ncbi:hypothetical protein [Sporichthya polymorpha]|uniref:hypothetical protein n=1 Tax=Sporichthya polymorpha TaxID=35751 RepID=UPI00038105EF|nr:hypothetical protein [Sporichthya polymorpha]
MKVRTVGLRWTAAMGAVGCVAAYTLLPSTANADVSTFTASAIAYPFRMATTNPTFPLGVPYEGYGPFASTNLTSIGAADAVAAGPYPGPVAVQGPGLVNATTGVQLPNYPFFVTAEAGEGARSVDNPFSTLNAASNPGVVTADAVLGAAFSGASANARSERLEFGGVRSTAESTYDILELANNIEIRGLRSVASAVSEGNGEAVTTSLLEFDSITAPGLIYQTPCALPPQLGVPEGQRELPCSKSEGLVLSFRDGQFLLNTPDGTKQAQPLDAGAVKSAFASIGVKMTYQEPVVTKDGVTAAGMTFSTDLPELPDNESGIAGVTTQVFEIGFAAASAKAQTTVSTFGAGTAPAAALTALGLLAFAGVARTRTNR